MLIEFSVENFRSIKGLETLNLSAANIVSKNKLVDESNVIRVSDKLTLLKNKAIYGANASGKSNLVKALIAFISVVNQSVKDESILESKIENFKLSTETDKTPTFFQLTFLLKKVQYRYGFQVTDREVISEWLFGTPGKKEVHYFIRDKKGFVVNDKKFKEGSELTKLYGKKNDIARPNSLFITAVKSLNGEISKAIVDYISSIIVVSGLADSFMQNKASISLKEIKMKKKIVDLLKIADTGITNVETVEFTKDDLPVDAPADIVEEFDRSPKHSIVVTQHKRFDSNLKEVSPALLSFDMHESQGSKKMFELSPFIIEALEDNRPLVIDEFDARFHPILTRRLMELFNSTTNKKTQIVVVTHDTNLLSGNLLRRDQICFVEKDKYGASHFYSLADFKGVRNDASFEKDYISGKYGAIPFIGDFNFIMEE